MAEATTKQAGRGRKADYPAANLMPGDAPIDAGTGYELVKGLIFDQVYKFRRRYGGDVEELTSEAHLAFMKGHTQFVTGTRPNGKPLDAPYATEIRRWVWFELFDAMRARIQQEQRATVVPYDDSLAFPDRLPDFDIITWTDGMSDDARRAVALVLDPPEPIEEEAQAKGGSPRNYRSTVRAYLRGAEEWTVRRVNDAFAEIRRALG